MGPNCTRVLAADIRTSPEGNGAFAAIPARHGQAPVFPAPAAEIYPKLDSRKKRVNTVLQRNNPDFRTHDNIVMCNPYPERRRHEQDSRKN